MSEGTSEETRRKYADALTQAGLSVTQPRLRVLRCFAEAGQQHLTAEDLHQYVQLQSVPLALPSIYRVLRNLTESGILARTLLGHGQVVYELGPREPHDHLVCLDCGRTADLGNEVLDSARRFIEQRHGYNFHRAPSTLFGRCLACCRLQDKLRSARRGAQRST